MSANFYRVVPVDDHELGREGKRRKVTVGEEKHDFDGFGEASTAVDLSTSISYTSPDVAGGGRKVRAGGFSVLPAASVSRTPTCHA